MRMENVDVLTVTLFYHPYKTPRITIMPDIILLQSVEERRIRDDRHRESL